ncbi:MAG TPA: 4Fe-4S dicluster domain-containing protein [Gammaproteobacteria bacterium]
MLHNAEEFDASRCHGCGLCAMVCPVYQQGGSVMETPHGWAKTLQGNDELEQDQVFACVLCGACAPLCPQDIDMMQMLIALRQGYDHEGELGEQSYEISGQKGKVVLIVDRELAQNPDRIEKALELLGGQHVQLALDQGDDISEAMMQGRKVSHGRLHQFLTSLQPVKKIIISDGLLQKLIKDKLPQIPMESLGRNLSSHTGIRNNIGANDYYVIDSQGYHADYARAVIYYDDMQQQTRCILNRDLHRLAIPTGAHAVAGFDHAAQIRWLMSGSNAQRVIAESLSDYQLLNRHCEQMVVHITELL